MTRSAQRRALFHLISAIGAAALVAIGCQGKLITSPPPCQGAGCSCDEDPLQPLCKGFNDRPEGGVIDMSDAQKVDSSDGSTESDGSEPADGGADALDDGGDEAG